MTDQVTGADSATQTAEPLALRLNDQLGPNAQAVERDPHRGGSSYEASMLRNLLARIHRDGGHYVEEHGLDKALEDADAQVVQWLSMQDRLADALFVLGMVGKNNRINAGAKGKAWSGRFVVEEVRRALDMREARHGDWRAVEHGFDDSETPNADLSGRTRSA